MFVEPTAERFLSSEKEGAEKKEGEAKGKQGA